MIVCCCHRVTEREIRRAAGAGARTPRQIAEACGAGASCGGCRVTVCEILDDVQDPRAMSSASSRDSGSDSVSA